MSVAFVGWISLGTQAAIANKQITFPTKPVSIEGCLHLVNITMDPVPTSRIVKKCNKGHPYTNMN
uniref:Uncharacterized protein n=1 Tax=Timema shepardi TaxID=629360 RepID=A0A7R9B9E8_TIMSH|nr:unnamed protein product [Timema shepardi]